MPDLTRDNVALALMGVALAAWLLFALVSAVARVWSGQPQSFALPWWGIASIGIAFFLMLSLEGVAIGFVLLVVGLFFGAGVGFSPLGQYRWWNRDAPTPMTPAEMRARAEALKSPQLVALIDRMEMRQASEPLPDRAPGNAKEYDGYENYVAEARKEAKAGALGALVQDNMEIPAAGFWFLNALQTMIGFGVGLFIGYHVLLWVRASIHGEVGFGGIAILLGIFLIGALAAALFVGAAAVIARVWRSWRVLAVYNFIALLFIWFGYVRPVFLS